MGIGNTEYKAPLKRLGLVSSSSGEFKKIAEEYASHSAIGHVRYSTVGKSDLESAQPLKVKDLCIAHNGTISNVEELSNLVGGCTFTPQNASDTLVAAQRLVSLITENGKLGNALSILKNEMVGSFCFTFLSDDDAVFAARDPKGFRPMVLGHKEDGNVHIVTSESSAISAIGAKLVRDVVPGELIKISKEGGFETEMFSDDKIVHIVHLNLHILLNHQVRWKEQTSILQENELVNFLQKNIPLLMLML